MLDDLDEMELGTRPDSPPCPGCGQCMAWGTCAVCGGEGEYSCYHEDPLWYDEDDTKQCYLCLGAGGWWICQNVDCKG